MAADAELFKRVMRRWASAVTIVTTKVGDRIHGLTVSGFAGISLDPPRVMVSVGRDQNSHLWLQDGGCYAVNLPIASRASRIMLKPAVRRSSTRARLGSIAG